MTSPSAPEPVFCTVKQASAMTGIGERTIYRLVANGELPSKRVGLRRFIPIKELKAFAEDYADVSTAIP